jgi:2-keto-4-pentenoate hydratase/2-oxohepta-3-ene-1,7-dioic acid hydratase in catechol pathway
MPGISKVEAPSWPIIFTKAPTSVVGHGGGIVYPTGVTDQVDYEGELGVVIGRGGVAIDASGAFSSPLTFVFHPLPLGFNT